MNQLLFYLLQVIAASGLLYGYYHFALRNKRFHRYNRFYLLMAVVISSLIPFLNIPVYFSEKDAGSSVIFQTLQVISSPAGEEPVSTVLYTEVPVPPWFTAERIIYLFYFPVLFFFLARVFISLNRIRAIIKRNHAELLDMRCSYIRYSSIFANNKPDWIPAIQNGHNVKAYRKQPFNFVITKE